MNGVNNGKTNNGNIDAAVDMVARVQREQEAKRRASSEFEYCKNKSENKNKVSATNRRKNKKFNSRAKERFVAIAIATSLSVGSLAAGLTIGFNKANNDPYVPENVSVFGAIVDKDSRINDVSKDLVDNKLGFIDENLDFISYTNEVDDYNDLNVNSDNLNEYYKIIINPANRTLNDAQEVVNVGEIEFEKLLQSVCKKNNYDNVESLLNEFNVQNINELYELLSMENKAMNKGGK